MTTHIFPKIVRLTISLPEDLREHLQSFVAEHGWTPDEGVKILLAYAADLRTARHRTHEEVVNEWGAARAEMALLRHRAFSADDSIQTLKMNVAGLEASNAQFARSFRTAEAEVAQLKAEVRDLEVACRQRGIPIAPEEPEDAQPVESLLAFFRHTDQRRDDGRRG